MNQFYHSESEAQKPSHNLIKRFLPSPFLMSVWVITLLLMMIVAAIALKGLIEPDLLNPNIIDPAKPEQPLTPSPVPAPQLVITPKIPQPPTNSPTPTLPNSNFPLWIFVGILSGSAFISLLVTGWLRYISLPPENQEAIANSVAKYSTFIVRVIGGIFNLIKQIILNICKIFINILNFLAQQSDQASTSAKKAQPKTYPQPAYTQPTYPPYHEPVEPIYNNRVDQVYAYNNYGYENPPVFNSPPANFAVNNSPYQNFEPPQPPPKRKPKKKAVKPKKTPKKSWYENFNQTPTPPKPRKKATTAPVNRPYPPSSQSQAPAYYQPQVTILDPQEHTPLDRRKPSLAEMMDLRRNRSLNSLLGD